MITVYARSDNNKRIIVLDADLNSLRCRQRNRTMDGQKVDSMRFASYKETMKNMKKYNTKVYGPYSYNTICKL